MPHSSSSRQCRSSHSCRFIPRSVDAEPRIQGVQPFAHKTRQRFGMGGDTGHMLAGDDRRLAARRETAENVARKGDVVLVRFRDDAEDFALDRRWKITRHDATILILQAGITLGRRGIEFPDPACQRVEIVAGADRAALMAAQPIRLPNRAPGDGHCRTQALLPPRGVGGREAQGGRERAGEQAKSGARIERDRLDQHDEFDFLAARLEQAGERQGGERAVAVAANAIRAVRLRAAHERQIVPRQGLDGRNAAVAQPVRAQVVKRVFGAQQPRDLARVIAAAPEIAVDEYERRTSRAWLNLDQQILALQRYSLAAHDALRELRHRRRFEKHAFGQGAPGKLLEQDYSNSVYSTLRGLDVGAKVTWNPTTLDTVTFNVARAVQDMNNAALTPGQVSPGYLDTVVSATEDHELLRNLIISGGASYTNDSFAGIDRVDNDYGFGAGAKYLMNRYLYLGLNYNYAHRQSSGAQATTPFSDNILMLRLATQL